MASISSFLKRKVKDRLSLLDAALEADTLLTRLKATLSRLFEGNDLPAPLPSLSSSGVPRGGTPSGPWRKDSRQASLATPRKGEVERDKGPSPDTNEEDRTQPPTSSECSQSRRPQAAPSVPDLVSPLPVEILDKFQQLLHQLLVLCRHQKALALQTSQKKQLSQVPASASSSGGGAGGVGQGGATGSGPGDEEGAAFGGLCTSLVTHPSGLRVLCACLHLGKAYTDKSASSAQLSAVSSIMQDALEILDLLFAAHAPASLGRSGPGGPACRESATARGVHTPQDRLGDASRSCADERHIPYVPPRDLFADWRCGEEADLEETSSDGDSYTGQDPGEGEEEVEWRREKASKTEGVCSKTGKDTLQQRESDASEGVYLQLMDGVMRHTENGSLIVSLLLLPEVYIQHDTLLALQKLYSFADDARRRGRETARRRRREEERREAAGRDEQTLEITSSSWLSADRFKRVRSSRALLARTRADGEGGKGGSRQRKRGGDALDLEERGNAVCQLLEDALLNRPDCIARLTGALQGGAADFVREEALEVLSMVTRRREEMKVIATFQGAIEALLSLLSSELGLPLYVNESSLSSPANPRQSDRPGGLELPPLDTTQVLLNAPRVRSILRCIYSLTSCGPACKYMREANLVRPLVQLFQSLLRAKEDHVKQVGRLAHRRVLTSEPKEADAGGAPELHFSADPTVSSQLAARPGGERASAGPSASPGVRTARAASPEETIEADTSRAFQVGSATPLDEALFLLLAVFGNFFPYLKKLSPSRSSPAARDTGDALAPATVHNWRQRERASARRAKQDARWPEAEVRANQTALLRSGVLDLISQHVAKVCSSLAFFSQSSRAASPFASLLPNLFRLFTRLCQLLLALVAQSRLPGAGAADSTGSESFAAQVLLLPAAPATSSDDRNAEPRAAIGGPPPFYCLSYAALQGGAPPLLQALLSVTLDAIVTSFPSIQEHILEGCLAALGASSASAPSLPSSVRASPGPSVSSSVSSSRGTAPPNLSSALPPVFACRPVRASPRRASSLSTLQGRDSETELGEADGDTQEPPPLQILPPGVVLAALLQWVFRRAVRTAEAATLAQATSAGFFAPQPAARRSELEDSEDAREVEHPFVSRGGQDGSFHSAGSREDQSSSSGKAPGETRRREDEAWPREAARASWRWNQAGVAVRVLASSLCQNPRLSLLACTRPLPSLGETAETLEPLLWQIGAVLLPALSRIWRGGVEPHGQRPSEGVEREPGEGDEKCVAFNQFFCRTVELLLALLLPDSERPFAARARAAAVGLQAEPSTPGASSAPLCSADAVTLSVAWLLSSSICLPSLLLLLLRVSPLAAQSPAEKGTRTLRETALTLLDGSVCLLLDRVVATLDRFAKRGGRTQEKRDAAEESLAAGGEGGGGGRPGRDWRLSQRGTAGMAERGDFGGDGGRTQKEENGCLVDRLLQAFPSLHVFFADLQGSWAFWEGAITAREGRESTRDEARDRRKGSGTAGQERKKGRAGEGKRRKELGPGAENEGDVVAQRAEDAQELLVDVLGVERLAMHVQRLQTAPAIRFSATRPVFETSLSATGLQPGTANSRSPFRSESPPSGESGPSTARETAADAVAAAARVPAALYSETLNAVGSAIEESYRGESEEDVHADASLCLQPTIAKRQETTLDSLRPSSLMSSCLWLRPRLASFFAFLLLPRETALLRQAALGADGRGLRMLLAVSGKRAERSHAGPASLSTQNEESSGVDAATREDFQDFLLFQEESIAELRRENARLAARTAKLQDALDPRREALVSQLQRETRLLRLEMERLLEQRSVLEQRLAGERRLAAAQLEDQQRQLEAVVVAFSQLEEELQARDEELRALRVELEAEKTARGWAEGGRMHKAGRDEASTDEETVEERLKTAAALAASREEELRSLQEKHTELLALLDLLVHRVPECLQFVCSLNDLPCRYTRDFQALAETQARPLPSARALPRQTETASSRSAAICRSDPGGAPAELEIAAGTSDPARERESGERHQERGRSSALDPRGVLPSPFASSFHAVGFFPSSELTARPRDGSLMWERHAPVSSSSSSSGRCEEDSGSDEPSSGGGSVRQGRREEERREDVDTSFSRLSCQSGATSPSFPPSAHRGAFSEASPQDETTRDSPTQIPSASLSSSSPSSPSSSAFPNSTFTASPVSALPGNVHAHEDGSLALVSQVVAKPGDLGQGAGSRAETSPVAAFPPLRGAGLGLHFRSGEDGERPGDQALLSLGVTGDGDAVQLSNAQTLPGTDTDPTLGVRASGDTETGFQSLGSGDVEAHPRVQADGDSRERERGTISAPDGGFAFHVDAVESGERGFEREEEKGFETARLGASSDGEFRHGQGQGSGQETAARMQDLYPGGYVDSAGRHRTTQAGASGNSQDNVNGDSDSTNAARFGEPGTPAACGADVEPAGACHGADQNRSVVAERSAQDQGGVVSVPRKEERSQGEERGSEAAAPVSLDAGVRDGSSPELSLGSANGGGQCVEAEVREKGEGASEAGGGETHGEEQGMIRYEDYCAMVQSVDESQLTAQQLEEWRNYRAQCEAFFAYQQQHAQWPHQA
ncbi:putative glutamic acid-rich protein [Neospora caninum Liverpool]|uniref:Putative glutamic acid-rich protein n=1 Tax=Neospora caninum (strain Liverpool) TaxID=572307 RepID=F0VBU0_NEOCL|nr:putative glutamic acid-rich protein [Neospora caninum Liverpool]CBZ51074.1 putative glutamic acid-rich protein [Neospora caninum Liverpool]|eukprot:XP_003881107.1 putative glutamic acid-rich protein [Neospora caninum Liverpool]